jgi:hypothetical protein
MPSTHWIERRVGCRAILDTLEKRKSLAPARKIKIVRFSWLMLKMSCSCDPQLGKYYFNINPLYIISSEQMSIHMGNSMSLLWPFKLNVEPANNHTQFNMNPYGECQYQLCYISNTLTCTTHIKGPYNQHSMYWHVCTSKIGMLTACTFMLN